MGEQRKKSHVWHWTVALLIGLPVLYVLSFPPACWLTAHRYFISESTASSLYRPILLSAAHAPLLEKPLTWWGSLGVPEGYLVQLEIRTEEFLAFFEFGDPAKYTDPHRDGVM